MVLERNFAGANKEKQRIQGQKGSLGLKTRSNFQFDPFTLLSSGYKQVQFNSKKISISFPRSQKIKFYCAKVPFFNVLFLISTFKSTFKESLHLNGYTPTHSSSAPGVRERNGAKQERTLGMRLGHTPGFLCKILGKKYFSVKVILTPGSFLS